MKKVCHLARSIKVQVLPLAIIYCLLVTTLVCGTAPIYAQANNAPFKIVLKSTDSSIGPKKEVRISAAVLNKKEAPIPGAKVKWQINTEAAPFVSASEDLGTNELILNGKDVASGSALQKPSFIQVFAEVGQITTSIIIPYQEAAKTMADDITFDPTEITISPGTVVPVKALVTSKGKPLPGEKVQWDILNDDWKKFVRIGAITNSNDTNAAEVFGLSPDPALEVPALVFITAKIGNVSKALKVKYQLDSPVDYKITIAKPKDAAITPGQEVTITATVEKNGATIVNPPIVWEIPEDMKTFVSLSAPGTDRTKLTLVGLYGDQSAPPPTSIPITARLGRTRSVINMPYGAGIEPQVDVSWNIVPPNIAQDNFGRAVSKDYYCIEVTIGNNSGGDLQLMGLGFDLTGVKDSKGQELVYVDRDGKPLKDQYGNSVGIKVPASSYDMVRGSQDKRKLWNPRTLLLTGLTALGQLMTGFNPYFINIRHANNYKTAVTIISNPLRDAVNNVLPDPIQAEINRLEQQALRDDRIISNNTTLKTTIFFPKNSVFSLDERNGKGLLQDNVKDDLVEVRRRLGQIVLVGYQIRRAGFINRVRRISSSATIQ
jgi:hypothetical protein